MSRPVYDALSDQQRDWVNTAMARSVTYQRELWTTASDEALEAVAAAGVEIIRPDKQPFRDAVAPMKAAFAQTELGPLIRRVEALEARS